MKVELNKRGLFVLTAETKQDNMVLFSITNSDTMTGIQLRFDKSPVSVPITDNTITKKTRAKRATKYSKKCPVEGCNLSTKGVSLHLLMKHGVHKDGTIHSTFRHTGEDHSVAEPVVKLPDGTLRLVPKPQLID